MFCTKCGAPNDDNHYKCVKCMALLHPETTAATLETSPVQAPAVSNTAIGRLQITRKSRFALPFSAFDIYINNEKSCGVKNGQTVVVGVPIGKHVLQVKAAHYFSPPYKLDVAENSQVNVTLDYREPAAKRFSFPVAMLFGFGPIVIGVWALSILTAPIAIGYLIMGEYLWWRDKHLKVVFEN